MTFDYSDFAGLLGDAESAVDRAWAKAWQPRVPLTISQWAEKYRVLPEASSAEPGDWSNARNPHLVEIMDVLSPSHPAEKIVFKKPTQVGGTEVLINAIGHNMCHDPGPIMLLVPGIDLAERHSKQRIAPSIEASEEWSRVVPPARSRDSGNTVRAKEFPGGILVIATANSSVAVRSMPVRYLYCDEVDEFLRNLNGQGSALEAAIRRTGTYQGRRKIYLCSSPTIKGDSIIDEEYEASDQRERHVPCPLCERSQVLRMDNLQDDGTYLCEHCGRAIEETHKDWMFERGVWIARFPERDVPGFHLNALYAPYRLGESWLYIAGERAKAKMDASKQVTFTNTYEGLAFEGERQQSDPEAIAGRAEAGRHRGRVPRGSLVLTIGVDCQHDRFEAQVIGWGRGQRGSIVDYDVIPGDPSMPEGYAELDAWLQRSYRNCGGAMMIGEAVAIDGGNWTEMVAQFVKSKVMTSGQSRLVQVPGGYRPQKLYVVRGRSAKSERVVYKPAKTEVNNRERTIARSVGVWGVGTDVAKNILSGWMDADANPKTEVERRMLRFPGGNGEPFDPLNPDPGQLKPEYYKGLAVEYFDLNAKRWITPRGARNEAFDTMVYAYWAALSPAVRLDMIRDHEWTALEERLEPAVDLFSPLPEAMDSRETSVSPEPAPPPAKPSVSDSRETSLPRQPRRPAGISTRDGWGL
ncbi:terminase gpA endonuclease subunit [Stenotrophomonas maltophilia]|uniref:phage terminase large subunit family protein n=1 Tax=Stenotrophomonas maltophilia TaxID=40324 RepID=UPI002ACCD856|nr:terminase gpA endonuclease subunit [Stenotrophomonas maltophilia]MDZ5815086.1 terminase gpA endonuclease subunit [Stenotrophomonas maltophilia]